MYKLPFFNLQSIFPDTHKGFTPTNTFVGVHKKSKNSVAQNKRHNAKTKARKRAKRLGHF